jgi:SAM-dependent methyltransferase
MPAVPENPARPADPPRVNDYDTLAEAYTADNETSLINAYYARPAILALAGDVTGRRILDAGCGSGPMFAALRDRGAILAGFDSSPGMIGQARRRLASVSPSSARAGPGAGSPRAVAPNSRICRASCAFCSSSCTPTDSSSGMPTMTPSRWWRFRCSRSSG